MAVGFAAVMLLSAITGLSATPGSATGTSPHSTRSALAASSIQSPVAVATDSHVSALLQNRVAQFERSLTPSKGGALAPNVAYADVREGSALVPSNLAQGGVAPGPTSIGVNDLGLRTNATGAYVAYSYRTTSLEGTVAINNLSLLPIEMNASSSITLQLNAVLNNVTVFGQSIYQIWAQNVIFYSVEGDQMQLATDAWNFTGAPFELFQNDIYENSPGGFLFSGTYVHAVPDRPPAWTLAPPFAISFYLNATNIGGRNALFFNYSVSSAHDITHGGQNFGHSISDGSFDWIIFNSTAGMPKGYRAPPASFLISGSQASNIGLPNDAEIAICGGSDGFSAITRSLNATAQLQFLNATTGTYAPVPAAFTTTEDTGESMEGVDAHFTAASAQHGVAYLTNGPEYVYGLWNASSPGTTDKEFRVSASPSTTLIWVSPTGGHGSPAFNNSLAAWDLSPTTSTSFWLPSGPGLLYTAAGLANDYTPAYVPLAGTGVTSISLARNLSEGVYVPIIAFGNSGVASIAQSGSGTATNPYVVSYSQVQPIRSLFAVYDIFTQPLYPGLLLSGVSAHVVIRDPPSLLVEMSTEALTVLAGYYGLTVPAYNNLPIEIYDSSNISLVDASNITGWFPGTLTGFLMASLFLSNDSHLLVAYDHFETMGSSMVLVDPNGDQPLEDNTVFGNVFATSSIVTGPDASSLYQVEAFNTSYTGPAAPGALGVFSSGNTVYGNLFETPITAYSPPQNPYLAYVFLNDFGYHFYSSVAVNWQNHWNISVEPTSYVRFVNGIALTGSVVGASFQGGNAWTNWNGSRPYTDAGLIVGGGDQLPLPIAGSPVSAVVFEQTGLTVGTGWTVSVGGSSYVGVGTLIVTYEPNGSYSFLVATGTGFAIPSHGTFSVAGLGVVIKIHFT
jgi:thermopsin